MCSFLRKLEKREKVVLHVCRVLMETDWGMFCSQMGLFILKDFNL